ncbi:IclR family transcriptional regulator [Piscinibacter sp.]|jgi:DNA-binding IclR family transcriptional regulator|uniref:IclR family transcriptional regulator n=1 Tax=Piscinibacter sp. TaxID=1903157 RepID=UPI003559F1DA
MPTQRKTSGSAPLPAAAPAPLERGQRGIQSVEVGGQLLLALAHHGRTMALKDLAREAGMAPAKAHPYLVSFGKLGLIAQDEASGRYGLGPLALQLGLISLQQFDPVRLATPLIAELAQALNLTVAIAVWGNRGPTIVRIEEAPSAVHVNMRHGTVMSLRGTASGLLFAAHLSVDRVLNALAQEPDDPAQALARTSSGTRHHPRRIDDALAAQLAQVREQRLSRVVDASVPGVSAMAAPVFDERGAMVLSLTAIGPSAMFDTRLNGPVAQALRNAAQGLSRQLGARAI